MGDPTPATLSIKSVPDHLAERLRRCSARHHHSLQGELLAILEAAVAKGRLLTPAELLEQVRSAGLETPGESVRFVREDRRARSRG